MRILVTGANGFIGGRLVAVLREAGHDARGTARREFEGFDPEIHSIVREGESFARMLGDCDALVHAAGVAHRPGATDGEYFAGNRDWTRHLAWEAARSGAKAMVHLSSIAARETGSGRSRRPSGYGLSKREAEPAVEALREAGKLGVNLRPPLVYGRGAPGNWGRLVRLARRTWPLPFASVRNRRSYIAIDHLADAVLAVLAKTGRFELSGTYEIADREAPSLPEVVGALRRGLGRRPGLFPFPPAWLAAGMRLARREAMAEGLLGDLLVDASAFGAAFDWSPLRPTLEAMAASVP